MKNRRRTLQIALLAAVAVAAAATAGILLAHRGERVWTTDSPAALAELERGLEADQKLYGDEATEHFQRAVELDPDFTIAKLLLLSRLSGSVAEERRAELAGEVLQADLGELSARERFLIEHFRARREEDFDRAAKLLASYLEAHPEDPFALNYQCQTAWRMREFAAAERCFQRLIEIDPNWVTAQNHLGYLAMAQGEWRRAEEQFAIYRYLAPDQANPHDSLAELLLLTGRWEEAREELETALAIKPDFCPSWSRLITLALLRSDRDQAFELLERIEREGRCHEADVRIQRCRIEVWSAFEDADWQRAWAAFSSPRCERYFTETAVMAYQGALFAGLEEEAAAVTADLKGLVRDLGMDQGATIVADHLEGIRLRHEGRLDEAVEKLRETDRRLAFWSSDIGYFKLATQTELWRALTAAGRHDEAARVLEGMRAVNPEIAELWTAHPSGDASAAARPPAAARDAG